MPMGAELDGDALLTLWERTLGQPPQARDEALLQVLSEGASPAQTLGDRNARLIDVHARVFGRELALLSRCVQCGTAVQFSTDCESLAAQIPAPDASASHRLQVHGHLIEFRLPTSTDIAAASGTPAENDFVLQLLERCVLACTRDDASVPVGALPEAVLDTLSQRMEALDPAASMSFAVECPHCDAQWEARLDVGQLLWQKIQAAAESLLLDIDALARAYGWTERDVLRLNPLRRAAYLQMVTA
jgi:hypothetical protein